MTRVKGSDMKKAFGRAAVIAAAILVVGICAGAQEKVELRRFETPYENLGLGGGGGMYTPAVSPVDPKLMFMTCDMSGVYRSVDGGRTWQIIPFREIKSARSMKVAFDPTDVNVMYTYGGPEYSQKLMVSRDTGMTWRPTGSAQPWGADAVVEMAVGGRGGRFLIAGTGKGAYVSENAGRTWEACKGIGGHFQGFHIVGDAEGEVKHVFAASDVGIWRSDDGGRKWASQVNGVAGDRLTGFCGGTERATGKTVIFTTIRSAKVEGKFGGGIYRSEDLGESWQWVMREGKGLNTRLGKVDEYGSGDQAQYYDIDMASGQTDVVYSPAVGTGYWPPNHNTIYRSEDSGETWRFVFSSDARFPELNVKPGWLKYDLQWGNDQASGFTVCDGDSDVLLRTENGGTYFSHDGGKTWGAAYTAPGPKTTGGKRQAWRSTGMEVTTTWDYLWDPVNRERQFICYTDIGFGRSEDGGKTWTYSADGSPWRNTFYDVVFDPERPGVMYAACSNVHDIPHSTYTAERASKGAGGVAESRDHGKTWKAISEELPEGPYTSICIDPESPAEARVMWATNFGEGVFKTVDGGKRWRKSSRGLGSAKNMRTFLVRRAPSGNLYCGIGPLRVGSNFPAPGGLYRSTDAGASWKCINAGLKLGWQTGFAVSGKNENVIYVCAASGWANRQGGCIRR